MNRMFRLSLKLKHVMSHSWRLPQIHDHAIGWKIPTYKIFKMLFFDISEIGFEVGSVLLPFSSYDTILAKLKFVSFRELNCLRKIPLCGCGNII